MLGPAPHLLGAGLCHGRPCPIPRSRMIRGGSDHRRVFLNPSLLYSITLEGYALSWPSSLRPAVTMKRRGSDHRRVSLHPTDFGYLTTETQRHPSTWLRIYDKEEILFCPMGRRPSAINSAPAQQLSSLTAQWPRLCASVVKNVLCLKVYSRFQISRARRNAVFAADCRSPGNTVIFK